MSKSFRIKATPGGDDEYIKVNLDLKQNFDFLEILSLKISQAEEYGSFCADYGVIAGRVIVNNGFGVPNVKVSIFIPVEQDDLDNEVIKEFYPYSSPNPGEKNGRGIRYNLLSDTQNTLDHTPVGTFREKRDTLDNDTSLEIYEKYYKYTTTTNEAGDYILFGVPVGEHILHYDMDISDIGFLSYRPYEMMAQGYSEKLFASRYKFKSSNNIDSLTQIISENIPITVEPYWCDSLSVGSTLGINRRDISIDQIELIPSAIFFGSLFSDDEKDSVNKNCRPDRDMGELKELITNEGKLEAIRRTVDGGIEKFDISSDAIDENGNWSVILPMNIRKVVTDEFGDLVPSPDGIKGVASEGDYRFKVSMDQSDTDKRLRTRAKFLVPNLTGNYNYGSYSQATLKNSTDFKINKQLSEATQNTSYSADTTNQYNYLEDFFTFRWKKVYTVKQYIGRFQKNKGDEGRSFIGIKNILNAAGFNKFPTNRTDTNIHVLYIIICSLLSFFAHLVALINGIIMLINGFVTMLCQIKIPVGLKIKLYMCLRILKGMCSSAYKTNPYSPGKCKNANNPCKCCSKNPSGEKDGEFSLKIYLKWKCIFGKALCKKCRDYCGNKHGCCIDMKSPDNPAQGNYGYPSSWGYNCPTNDYVLRDAELPFSNFPPNCCCKCCLKVPVIKLFCHDEGLVIAPSIIKTPWASDICNKTFVYPFCCKNNCGGPQTAIIKDWLSCVMEPIAVWLKMLKFDFYNDWVSGSLYFPLIKRKYKVKTRAKKFGQIKKDKFCDFECIIRDWGATPPLAPTYTVDGIVYPAPPPPPGLDFTNSDNFQGPPYYMAHRVAIRRIFGIFPRSYVTDIRPGSSTFGCRARVRKLTTEWFGTITSTQNENLNLAASTIVLNGKDNQGNGCRITFAGANAYSELATMIQADPVLIINNPGRTKLWQNRVSTYHGKPEYVKTEDPLTGVDTWVNIGGHGHHKNICNKTLFMERSEYFKTELDCISPSLVPDMPVDMEVPAGGNDDGDGATGCNDCCGCLHTCDNPPDTCDPPASTCCQAKCGSNGVAACNAFCNCEADFFGIGPDINNYKSVMYHGLVVMGEKDKDIYYAVSMKPYDPYFNQAEYKANLFYPVGVTELGSSTYCDIDEAPFIMDQLSPTTFNVSMEGLKYKLGTLTSGNNIPIKKIEDKEGTLNLRAYVEFSCIATVCLNTMGTVNHSQLGVEMIEKNDMGIEIGNCWTRFDHDADLREYFCKRFSGYKNSQLDVWYQKAGSQKFENNYGTYAEIRLEEGYNPPLTYQLPDGGAKVPSEYNDGEYFIPGDACGYYRNNDTTPSATNNPLPVNLEQTDYFYGLAPGVTASLSNFPNTVDIQLAGNPGHSASIGNNQDDVDVISYLQGGIYIDDNVSGSANIHAIRFNRSQTPYFLYFGLLAGKTSLHKVVGKFFADKINAVTLQGIKPGNPTENQHNKPNIANPVKNLYSIYKTCLGEVEIPIVGPSFTPTATTTFTGVVPCDLEVVATPIDESLKDYWDGSITLTVTSSSLPITPFPFPPYTYQWFPEPNGGWYGDNGSGCVWLGQGGTPTDNVCNLAPGVYTVTVTDDNGCSVTKTVTIGTGAEVCCSSGPFQDATGVTPGENTRLIQVTVGDAAAAAGQQFCWKPCNENRNFTTAPSSGYQAGQQLNFNSFASVTTDLLTSPDMTTYICATYPPPGDNGSGNLSFPETTFYLCSCEDAWLWNGNINTPGISSNLGQMLFSNVSSGNLCGDAEHILPEQPPDPPPPPCATIESDPAYPSPDGSDTIIDDTNIMGTLKDDGAGGVLIEKGATVMRNKVIIPSYGSGCNCPNSVYVYVNSGEMELTSLTRYSVNSLLISDPTIYNRAIPMVRAMVRVTVPQYNAITYSTTAPRPIIHPLSGSQPGLDYLESNWYNSLGNEWSGQAVFDLSGGFNGPPPLGTLASANLGNSKTNIQGQGSDWFPMTAYTGGQYIWEYASYRGLYQPHLRPDFMNALDYQNTGDYAFNDKPGNQYWGTYNAARCDDSNSVYMTWHCQGVDWMGSSPNPQQVFNPCGEGLNSDIIAGNNASPTLSNSLLYPGNYPNAEPVLAGTSFNGATTIDDGHRYGWLQVSTQVNGWFGTTIPANATTTSKQGTLIIDFHKPGEYIIETALYQYNSTAFIDGGKGYGTDDSFMEIVACSPPGGNDPLC